MHRGEIYRRPESSLQNRDEKYKEIYQVKGIIFTKPYINNKESNQKYLNRRE
jgi:hypothetical protein